jgi:LmbE family N-acetylglucosaminyl deacetylase
VCCFLLELPLPPRPISELLERTLVIVAHPDDECIGAGALMQRIREPVLIFCTDGGPRDSYFWEAYGSRERYSELRRQEAANAAQAIGIRPPTVLPIVDQELFRNLHRAYRELENRVRHVQPDAILTLSYEGGHPDHDCCAFLSHALGVRQNLPVWEMPIYHRTSAGPRKQQFVHSSEDIQEILITAEELARKRKMVESYPSQGDLLGTFDIGRELFRPQARYDFLQPPSDAINYEFWQWPITAKEACRAFSAFTPADEPNRICR